VPRSIPFMRSCLAAAAILTLIYLAAAARADTLFVSNLGSPLPSPVTASGAPPITRGQISKIAPGGIVSPFAIGLSDPTGVAFNPLGDLFVGVQSLATPASVLSLGAIDEVSPTGYVAPFAKLPGQVDGLTLGPDADLYASVGLANIDKISPGGKVSVFATLPPIATAAPATTPGPTGLTFGPNGDLYVSDYSKSEVYQITPAGKISPYAHVSDPEGLAFNSAGDLFVSGTGPVLDPTPTNPVGGITSAVFEITPSGLIGIVAAAPDSDFLGLKFDSAGNLFAANAEANAIDLITPGTVTPFAVGIDAPRFIATPPPVVPVITTTGSGAPDAIIAVPEPTTLGLFAVSAFAVLFRRRRN
jgi:PEP-CTERM motif